MALRAVPDHPKFADFKRRLGLTKGCALGYLECIWHFTGRFTPAGNIGKYQDSAIEAWVEWNGEPGQLVAALIESGWAHRHDNPDFRVVIHDWSEHADDIVNTVLARRCEYFWDGKQPKSGKLNRDERERFRKWLEGENLSPNPSHRPAKKQPEVSRKSAESPKPAPAPAPAPAPEEIVKTEIVLETSGVLAKASVSPSSCHWGYLRDAEFAPFAMAALQFWPDLIEEDLQRSWQFTWKRFDFTQKLECVKRLKARIEAGEDANFVTRLPKYLEDGDWKRPPRKSAQKNGRELMVDQKSKYQPIEIPLPPED